MVENIVTIIQVILSILLIVVILLQQNGGGIGAAFGGGASMENTKRGVDLSLHRLTIAIAILFFISSFALLFV